VGFVGSDVIVIRLRLYTDVTSSFASESVSKLDSLDSRNQFRIRALNGRIRWICKILIWNRFRIRQIEYGHSLHITTWRLNSRSSLCMGNFEDCLDRNRVLKWLYYAAYYKF